MVIELGMVMDTDKITYVTKACAYVTRDAQRDDRNRELLVFEGPEHDGLQIPKGTVENDESPREAVRREIEEESGISTLESVRHLVSDVWTRRHSPPKRYRRHFFHAWVDDPRDEWTHVVTGDGSETGFEFEYYWLELPPDGEFALSLDDYVHLVTPSSDRGSGHVEKSNCRNRTTESPVR